MLVYTVLFYDGDVPVSADFDNETDANDFANYQRDQGNDAEVVWDELS